ncbi:MAG: hypothetical protein HGA19_07655 [Oscillochloris sp.]|nr:hypothetical protein [Oscillochloris sp.]
MGSKIAIFFFAGTIIALLALTPSVQVVAQEENLPRVTVVVLDQSGSMRTTERPSDPLGLRCSAVRLLADLATDGDYLALVKLESRDLEQDLTAEVLSPAIQMGTEVNRNTYKGKITCNEATNNTPIADALAKAFGVLDDAAKILGRPFSGQVLLLTDGDPLPRGKDQIASIRKLLPQFQARHWPVNTIGLKLREHSQKNAMSLLAEMASTTGGRNYGDIAEPIELQGIFVQFFAQQTGRTLSTRETFELRPGSEVPVNVASYANRVDILVAKSEAGAHIRLLRPDNTPVRQSDSGVVLYSDDDRFYAAYSIEVPVTGRWKIQSDQQTSGVVNMLVTTDLQLRFKDTGTPRPSNQPITLEALFYKRTQGSNTPVPLKGVEVLATLDLAGQSLPMPLHDDGVSPDEIAGDGIYAGAVPLGSLPLTLEPVSGQVKVEAVYAGQPYNDFATIQVIGIPSVVMDDPDGILRLPPDSPVVVPLRLDWQGRAIPPTGWRLEAVQTIAGETRKVPVEITDTGFQVTLDAQPEGEDRYAFSATLIGVEQHSGLPPQKVTFDKLRVSFQPTLSLSYEGPTDVPVGYTIVMHGALLSRFNAPEPRSRPLDMELARENMLSVPISGLPEAQKGTFAYSFTPTEPGLYHFVLFDREQRTATSESVERIFLVRPRPAVSWEEPFARSEGLQRTLIRWPMLDQLRAIPVLGWPTYWFANDKRSEQLTLRSAITIGEQPFDQAYIMMITRDGEAGPPIFEKDGHGGQVVEVLDLPAGNYDVQLRFDQLFGASISCCSVSTTLIIQSEVSPFDMIIGLEILSGEAVVVLLALSMIRYTLAPKPRRGDRLAFRLPGATEEIYLPLDRNWGFNLISPSVRNLQGLIERKIRAKLGRKGGKVTYSGRGVQMGTQRLTEQERPLPGISPPIQARFIPARKRNSRQGKGPFAGLWKSVSGRSPRKGGARHKRRNKEL